MCSLFLYHVIKHGFSVDYFQINYLIAEFKSRKPQEFSFSGVVFGWGGVFAVYRDLT